MPGQGLEIRVPRRIDGPELLIVAADPVEQIRTELFSRVQGIVEEGDAGTFAGEGIQGFPPGFPAEETVAVAGDDNSGRPF